jgi:hypothetical protein
LGVAVQSLLCHTGWVEVQSLLRHTGWVELQKVVMLQQHSSRAAQHQL